MGIISVIQWSLIFGLAYAAFLTVLILGSMRWNLEIWYDDFPDPIKARYGHPPAQSQKARRIFSIVLAVFLLGLPLVGLWWINLRIEGAFPFPARAFAAYLIVGLFQLVDLLGIDGLLGMVIDPRWLRLPGTEDGPSYWTFGRHWRDFLKAMAIMIPVALLLGGVSLLFF
jgi:hypothetical protein